MTFYIQHRIKGGIETVFEAKTADAATSRVDYLQRTGGSYFISRKPCKNWVIAPTINDLVPEGPDSWVQS